ncbi:MAG: PEGA domain-containing protein [Dysgonamonadaceae bacterium]|jgi:hypothetical protein|nr:PEGA domain-containing protein [Dysgonamonadaceae bacterium]
MKHVFVKTQWLVLFTFLLASISINAQITITSFEETIDQEARTSSPRRDQNGNLYALIKISTSLNCSGFTQFDFGQIGFGEIDCANGHVWVYAPAQSTKVSIYHSAAGAKENYLFPVPLRSGTVYVMTIASGTARTVIDETPQGQFLVAQCNVAGATIDIRGQARTEFKNGIYQKFLPFGKYTYTVDAPRYLSDRGAFEITPNGKTTLQITLVPNFVTVTLSGDGDIYLDEELKGAGQWTGELAAGTYRAEVRKPSHRSGFKTFTVEAGKDVKLALPAPEPVYGALQVSSTNALAQIFIDGKSVDETTPAILQKVLAGPRNITLRAEGYLASSQIITIEEGKITPVEFTLTPDEQSKKKTEPEKKQAPPKEPAAKPEKPKNSTRLFAEYAYSPAAPAGGFLGICKNWGGYVHAKTDLLGNDVYTINRMDGFPTDETIHKRFAVTAGLMRRIVSDWAYLYAGAGYGMYCELYRVASTPSGVVPGNLYIKDDVGYRESVEVELGAKIVIAKYISLSAGYSIIPGKTYYGDFNIGLGIAFKL